MNPHQRNKIDINSLSDEEKKVFRLYGKLPQQFPTPNKLPNKLLDRKYFDSGDYALLKAGKGQDSNAVGTEHPVPGNMPHILPGIVNSAQVGSGNLLGQSAGTALSSGTSLNQETRPGGVDMSRVEEKPTSSLPAAEGISAGK